jgi:hypothetical protein
VSLLGGWILACTGAGHSGGCVHRTGVDLPAAWVACDRSRNQVLWLDRDLIVRERWRVNCPVAIAWSEGQLWVASAVQGTREGPHRIFCLQPSGRLVGSWNVGPVRSMVSLANGGVLLLGETDVGGAVLWRCGGWGRWTGPLPVPGARHLRTAATGIWVLGAPGSVEWLDKDWSRSLESIEVPDRLQTMSGFHLQGDKLWLRGAAKSSSWIPLDAAARRWGSARRRPWLPESLSSIWPDHARERKPASLMAWLNARTVLEGPNGGWLVQGNEYIWHLDARGNPLVGQGGFGVLTGAVAVGH